MKNNFFIGLGGSGGKIITCLYERLLKERGASFGDDVACIAIDTERSALEKLGHFGVEKICITGQGSVGQYVNLLDALDDSVHDWFPDSPNESVLFGDDLFNGASQSRMKSRLCFAAMLSSPNNELERVLEQARTVGATDDADDVANRNPVVIIASSLAGGTGSGTFIQTALYVRNFFRRVGIQKVVIYGLFACPDLYTRDVKPIEHRNLYANAYAAIRELNAFNLVCGPDETTAYGVGKPDLDIAINTAGEGELFTMNDSGRYDYKPYDNMYFIDKVNSMSTIRGGLEAYYAAIADIAYTHFYTPIREKIQAVESNETKNHIIAPTAIYGSAGAGAASYPYQDLLDYFATRALLENVKGTENGDDTLWTYLDNKWKHYLAMKDVAAKQKGLVRYTPAPNERQEEFINNFEEVVKPSGSAPKFAPLAPMVYRNEKAWVPMYVQAIKNAAAAAVNNDSRLQQLKKDAGLNDLAAEKASVLKKVQAFAKNRKDNSSQSAVFKAVQTIDDGLQSYCKKAVTLIADMAIEFSNRIFCQEGNLSGEYDRDSLSILQSLLYNNETKSWAHPVAARYLLYKFKELVTNVVDTTFATINDTPADDTEDFSRYLLTAHVDAQLAVLRSDQKSSSKNSEILSNALVKKNKRITIAGLEKYFRGLEDFVADTSKSFTDALLLFSYTHVLKRIDALIAQYETFFDNLNDFTAAAAQKTENLLTMHEKATGHVYVLADSVYKEMLYEDMSAYLDVQNGEIGSKINESVFRALRSRAVAPAKKGSVSLQQRAKTVGDMVELMAGVAKTGISENSQIMTLDFDFFGALCKEYELKLRLEEESGKPVSEEAKKDVISFAAEKLNALATLAAPALLYNNVDKYYALFHNGEEARDQYTSDYRFISHGASVGNSIKNSQGISPDDFYSACSAKMLKNKANQTVNLAYVPSADTDDKTVRFYSAVTCLQPYQINNFDELGKGRYYTSYANAIEEMERLGKYSLSPHLDKRWHKHSSMPYINVAKERERRSDLGKALVFAFLYSKIGYEYSGSLPRFVFEDDARKREAEVIIHKGRSIPVDSPDLLVSWFADQESLIARYAAKLDMEIEHELYHEFSKSRGNVQAYNTAITSRSKIMAFLRDDILGKIPVMGSKSGKVTKPKTMKPLCLIELAYMLHKSEETNNDRDYGELLIESLCAIIKQYAAFPFNKKEIASKSASDDYSHYCDAKNNIATNVFKVFYEKTDSGKKERSKEERARKAAARKAAAFGRATRDTRLTEKSADNETDTKAATPASKPNLDAFPAHTQDVQWAKPEFLKHLED